MLLLDRLEHFIKGISAIGIKNVTINEPFFSGHFPGKPVMPGVLIVEAMAQTAAALVIHSLGVSCKETLVYFMSISDARFRSPVTPGDTLRLHVEKKHQRGMVWRFYGKAMVGGKIVAEATYTAQISVPS
jgi:3-hydroxyacyl-[acyl-carrier-protein] dehydratase